MKEPEPIIINESEPGEASAVGENVFEGVRRLELDLRANVEITGSDDPFCALEFEGAKAEIDACSVYTEGETLVVKAEEKRRLFGFGGTRLRLMISLPAGMKSVSAQLRGGDFKLKGVEAGEVKAKTGGGDIDVRSCTISVCGLVTGGGEIEIEEITCDKLETTSGGGDIKAEGVRASSLITAHTGGGDILVCGAAKCVDAASGGGDIDLKLLSEGIKTKTGGGDVDIEAEGVKFIGAKTGGGDISVRLTGCTGLSADVASLGGTSEISYLGERLASGRKLELTAGDASARLEMRSGGGDITVVAK